ncbi:hypothetical protein TYRP_013772 [Tyrophagus putrescentiae]|nr:hypothetical protein TYRP_013772 [Tyrophagus putrescentiae]
MMHQVFTSLMAPIRYDALSARLGQYVTQIGLLVVSITSPVTLNSTFDHHRHHHQRPIEH